MELLKLFLILQSSNLNIYTYQMHNHSKKLICFKSNERAAFKKSNGCWKHLGLSTYAISKAGKMSRFLHSCFSNFPPQSRALSRALHCAKREHFALSEQSQDRVDDTRAMIRQSYVLSCPSYQPILIFPLISTYTKRNTWLPALFNQV